MPQTVSPAMQHVLDRMRTGWQLGQSITMDGRYWLQQGGCGKGGASETVNASTAHALYKRGLIVRDVHKFPLQTYRLNE